MRANPFVIAGLALLVGCKREQARPPAPVAPAETTARLSPDPAQVKALFAPLPPRFDSAANPATPERIALGRMLFFEHRLSRGQDLSCASCHDLANGGTDRERFSKGHKGKLGGRNAPTVYNAAGQIAQFWDGRAPSVEEQAKGPMTNPIEMAMPEPSYVVRTLRSIPGYVDAFADAFPGERDPITYDNVGRAIGAFERGLVTPGRFDDMLSGTFGALEPAEREGLAIFLRTGCGSCHNGSLVGGGMYMKLGLVEPYANSADPGRFAVTKQEGDRMLFKVAMLRNVADTAPYFHDGSIPDLATAVKTMARLQLGKQLTDIEVASIVTFLTSLSGTPEADYIAKPELPRSGPNTPKPS